MNKYEVQVEWAGYSRGEATYIVEAESEEEARKRYYQGKETERFTVRDDTDEEPYEVKLVNQ